MVALMAATVVGVSGCAPGPGPSAGHESGLATSPHPPAATAGQSSSSSPAATATPTLAPTPSPAPVLAASWAAPKDGATLATPTLKFSATVSFDQPKASVSQVIFTVKWGSTAKTACKASQASGDRWTCAASLWKLGAPLGKLRLSFNVTDSAGEVTKAPGGSRSVTFALPPPEPTNVRITEPMDPSKALFRMTWRVGAGPVSSFLIYATPMDFCKAYRWTVAGRSRLVATVPASSRSWNGKSALLDGAEGWRFAVAASNAAGRSASVVATHGPLIWDPAAAEDVVTDLGTCGGLP
jgi:hypothetical protein